MIGWLIRRRRRRDAAKPGSPERVERVLRAELEGDARRLGLIRAISSEVREIKERIEADSRPLFRPPHRPHAPRPGRKEHANG